MAKQLIVSVNGREKKIAIIEDDKVAEFYIERGEQHQGIVGNIYKGRVMRVLPGMQSAFVDIGLERDAFLYVSDFFDEEEEFERIVIDKSKKGTPDAEHAAAEEVALNRVEREQRIEASHERAEPLLQEPVAAAPPAAEEVSETQDKERNRRGRRGRRGRRWEKGDEAEPATPPQAPHFEIPDTPFVAGDPSIERIVDEEETAANGEMFKDARLQERLFDQIHAVEFNMEDDFRTAEVGSILTNSFASDSFERIADDEGEAEPIREGSRPPEAHVSTFIDDVESDTLPSIGFERISDDEEEAPGEAEEKQPSKRARKSPAQAGGKKRAAKGATKTASKKKASSKRSSKKRAASTEGEAGDDSGESTANYSDSDARVTESQSRGEFATRRGGRRRRRPSGKNKPQGASAGESDEPVAAQSNGEDDEPESLQVAEPEEIVAAPPPAPVPAPAPSQRRQRDQRDQRDKRDQRGYRGNQSRRERHQPAITDLLSEGQEILVQIAKEPIAKKGARITSHIALP